MNAKNYKVNERVTIYNAKLMFRNFSGEPSPMNAQGNRNFCIFLEDDIAKKMEADGWRIRWLKPMDDDGPSQAMIRVRVAFGNYPPTIITIANGKKTKLNEETINDLDTAEIETCDVILSPYNYKAPGGAEGVSAYLKSMYVTLVVDDLAKKYDYFEGEELSPSEESTLMGKYIIDGMSADL